MADKKAPPESTRKALQAFLTSQEGQDFTMETAKAAAQTVKRASFKCPHCRYTSQVEVPDANGAVNALKFMHEWGLTRPKDEGELVPKAASLRDLTPAQVEKLRQLLYTRAKQEL